MFQILQRILLEDKISLNKKGTLQIASVTDKHQGFLLGEHILQECLTKETLLFLSGGKTPKELYEDISQHGSFSIGAVGLVDERGGEPFHGKSNERMIKESGILAYLESHNVPFHPILKKGISLAKTAELYDAKVRSLLANFRKSIAILGIGLDGHTAGILGNRTGFTNPLFDQNQQNLFVSAFEDPQSEHTKRITMTFLGLSMMDVLLVFVFGEEKKHALALTFSSGSVTEVPARFYMQPEIAKKTLFITDQIL